MVFGCLHSSLYAICSVCMRGHELECNRWLLIGDKVTDSIAALIVHAMKAREVAEVIEVLVYCQVGSNVISAGS